MRTQLSRVLVLAGMLGCGDNLRIEPAPGTVIDRPPAMLSATTHVEVAFHALGTAAGFTCSLDRAAPAACESPWTFDVADGAHELAIVAIGAGGDAGDPAVAGFTVDTAAPGTTIRPPLIPPRTSLQRPIVFFAVADASTIMTTCSVDAGPAAACDGAAGFHAAADLPEGPHTYRVTATDAAGNPSVASVAFDVDITPPMVTITGGTENPTNDPTPTFTFTTSADTVRTRCELDTGEVIDPCTTGVAFPPISPAAHTFTVTAFDGAVPANTASAVFPFVLGSCGDGIAQGTEACDGGDLRSQSCAGLGFTAGQLACTASCTLDTSGCTSTCGDGRAGGTEACDGADLRGTTCESLGHAPGALACARTCDGFDTSRCDGGFVAANTGFAGTVCFDGVKFNQPGLVAPSVVACTENGGAWRTLLDPAVTWAGVNGTTLSNLHGRAIVPQSDGPSTMFLTDNSTAQNGFRSNNFTTWTPVAFATAGSPVELFAVLPGSSTGSVLGGWHPALGAIVLHGNFSATATASAVGPTPGSVTGTVRAIAKGGVSDIYVAVFGQTPAGDPATGGGIYLTCDQIGTAGGTYIERDTGIADSDRPLVWSITADPTSFTPVARTCGASTVSGFATTYYAALRGGGAIYKTTDGGVTWTQSNAGLRRGAEVYKIALDCFSPAAATRCADHTLLYAATSVGLYKSTDAGAHWSLAGLEGKPVRGVALEPDHAVASPPRIFVGVDDAVGIYQANAP